MFLPNTEPVWFCLRNLHNIFTSTEQSYYLPKKTWILRRIFPFLKYTEWVKLWKLFHVWGFLVILSKAYEEELFTVRWQREKRRILGKKVTEDKQKGETTDNHEGTKALQLCSWHDCGEQQSLCSTDIHTCCRSTALLVFRLPLYFWIKNLILKLLYVQYGFKQTNLCEGVLGDKIKPCRAGGKTKSHKRLKGLTLTAIFSDTSWIVTNGG